MSDTITHDCVDDARSRRQGVHTNPELPVNLNRDWKRFHNCNLLRHCLCRSSAARRCLIQRSFRAHLQSSSARPQCCWRVLRLRRGCLPLLRWTHSSRSCPQRPRSIRRCPRRRSHFRPRPRRHRSSSHPRHLRHSNQRCSTHRRRRRFLRFRPRAAASNSRPLQLRRSCTRRCPEYPSAYPN